MPLQSLILHTDFTPNPVFTQVLIESEGSFV